MAIYDLLDKSIILKSGDDVAVVTESIDAGTMLKYNGQNIYVKRDIPAGHKVALTGIRCNNPIL